MSLFASFSFFGTRHDTFCGGRGTVANYDYYDFIIQTIPLTISMMIVLSAFSRHYSTTNTVRHELC